LKTPGVPHKHGTRGTSVNDLSIVRIKTRLIKHFANLIPLQASGIHLGHRDREREASKRSVKRSKKKPSWFSETRRLIV